MRLEDQSCGVANQPYYPSTDDFRRAGKQRDIMCFTMGNASCNRNYSIMVLDGCPTNIVPGERYLANRVVNQQMQRFYDTFDGYINDSPNNNSLLTVTIALESFSGKMDWNATNEAAIRYMVKKAASEKIIFTSAADIADYHRKNNLDMQSAYFFQPDYYYGYHNGTMPGRIDDRLEADTSDYLAVIRRSAMLPMYFYDYTVPWDSCLFEDTERNEFGLIDPDEHKPSECFPEQVLRLISGKKIREVNGMLSFTVNACWEDESAILYGYEKTLLAENLPLAKIRLTGPTTCSRWSGQ